jgi:hypothetical protein
MSYWLLAFSFWLEPQQLISGVNRCKRNNEAAVFPTIIHKEL